MKFPTLRSYLFISQTLICFLPHGCGGGGGSGGGSRPCAPPLRAPPSARLLGAVEQGELPQLLLSDLVVVVLREQRTACLTHIHKGEKKNEKGKHGHLSFDGNRCSRQQQMSSNSNYLDAHRKHMLLPSVEYPMKNVS